MPKRCFWNLLKTKKKGCLKQGKPLRNVRLESPQATRQNPWKTCVGRACEKAEPQQVLCPSHCETAARKIPKRCFWNLLKTKKKGCLKQGKPLRNVRLESPQATRQNPWKTCLGRACEKAEPQQVLCPSHCETAAWKIPKRCFWNPLKRPLEPIKNNALVTVHNLLQQLPRRAPPHSDEGSADIIILQADHGLFHRRQMLHDASGLLGIGSIFKRCARKDELVVVITVHWLSCIPQRELFLN